MRSNLKLVILLSFLTGCFGSIDLDGNGDHGSDPDDNVTDVDKDGDDSTPKGVSHKGFGGRDLTSDRAKAPFNSDRVRLKPFSALRGEYPRVLGTTPASLNGAADTFADASPPWYIEPGASGQTAYAAFAVAFEGCLSYVQNGAAYAAAPTADTAATECSNFAMKFWSRAASNEERAECVAAATTDSTTETNVRRRWAYVCASVLTSSGFLAY